jgi:hypothetical protein
MIVVIWWCSRGCRLTVDLAALPGVVWSVAGWVVADVSGMRGSAGARAVGWVCGLGLPWAAPRFPDSRIGAISCCELPVQVLVVGFLRSPVPEC